MLMLEGTSLPMQKYKKGRNKKRDPPNREAFNSVPSTKQVIVRSVSADFDYVYY